MPLPGCAAAHARASDFLLCCLSPHPRPHTHTPLLTSGLRPPACLAACSTTGLRGAAPRRHGRTTRSSRSECRPRGANLGGLGAGPATGKGGGSIGWIRSRTTRLGRQPSAHPPPARPALGCTPRFTPHRTHPPHTATRRVFVNTRRPTRPSTHHHPCTRAPHWHLCRCPCGKPTPPHHPNRPSIGRGQNLCRCNDVHARLDVPGIDH